MGQGGIGDDQNSFYIKINENVELYHTSFKDIQLVSSKESYEKSCKIEIVQVVRSGGGK